MTTRVIKIVIDSSGAKRGGKDVETALAGVDKQAKGAEKSTLGVGRALTTGAILLAAQQIISIGDAWASLQGQLRLVTDSTAELENVTKELFDISQRTRQEIGATADLYIRLGRSTDFSNERILGLTETIGQTIALSRASPQAAQAALFQLGQGFAAGALRGEELNSVLEQTPELAKAIADGLGETTGGLRLLGAEGKLTAELVAEALEDSASRVNEEFSNVPLTVGDAITKVGNSLTVFVGRLDEATGATSALAEGLNQVSNFITGLGVLIGDDQGFGAQAGRIGEEIDKLRDRAEQLRKEIAGEFDFSTGLVGFLGQDAEAAAIELAKVEASIRVLSGQQLELIGNNGLTNLEVAKQRAEDIRNAFEDSTNLLADIFEEDDARVDRFVKQFETAKDKAIRQLEDLNEFVSKGIIDDDVAADIRARLDDVLNPLEEIEINVEKRELDDASQSLIDAADNAQNLREQIEAFSRGGQQELDATVAFQEAKKIIEETGEAAGVTAEALGRVLAEEQALERELQELQQETEAAEEAINVFFDRARENSQDILADFFAGGFEDLDDFEAAFAQMLLNLASQALASEIFSILFGGEDSTGGGILGAALNSFGFGGGRQQGGPVNPNQTFLVGENGPELFRPPSSGEIVPNEALQAPAPQVNVAGPTIVNMLEDSDVVGAINRAGGDVIINKITENRDAVLNGLGL